MNSSNTIVIFGASGDLTQRKLLPALYNLYDKKRLPAPTSIVGFSRQPYTDFAFQEIAKSGILKFSSVSFNQDTWDAFKKGLFYIQGDLNNPNDIERLKQYLLRLERTPSHRLYYLAIPPSFYKPVIENLRMASMSSEEHGYRSIIIEKPFGYDYQSAESLNSSLHTAFQEKQIFRIDHYLGKETAQNILFFRFANTIFEPVWNRNYIDNIQITVFEDVDVGRRASYYDSSGILRDMFQNHLMQLLTLVTMEPPSSFDADALRNEKVKVLDSIRPIHSDDIILGQYKGYRDLEGISVASQTPTYAAINLFIDNWRWKDVPVFLRSGKALERKFTEIVIEFKLPPHLLFSLPEDYTFTSNILSLCIFPDEEIHLKFEAKVPDSIQETRSVDMEFHYRTSFSEDPLPEAYERLVLDAIKRDASLFARNDEIEKAWKLIDPISGASSDNKNKHVLTYDKGSTGPSEANQLLAKTGRKWHAGCDLHD